MNQVKIYDNFGSLKKVISSKELQKRADMLITNPSQYRKTNKNKPLQLYLATFAANDLKRQRGSEI